jgi:hypothetical protein
MGFAAAQAVRMLAPDADAARAAAIAALLYAAQGAHGLTVAWASAANSLMANALVGLAVGAWLAAWQRRGPHAWALSTAALTAFALALLCREIGVVAPALALLLTAPQWARVTLPRLAIVRDLAGAAIVAGVWWLLRSAHVVDEEQAYALAVGGNVPTNAFALAMFALNVPREALRFLIEQPTLPIIAWALTCAGLQAASLLLLWRAVPAPRRHGAVWGAVAIVGCSPYLLLSGQSYPYYIGVGLLAVAVLAAAGTTSRGWKPALACALLSSALANGGEQRLPQPALYARAIWAEQSLKQLNALARAHPEHFAGRLIVEVEDERDFYAIGQWGVAVRTGMPAESVFVDYPCEPGANAVRFQRDAPPRLFRCPDPALPASTIVP